MTTRAVGRLALLAALVGASAVVLRFIYVRPPMFHNYGVVHTSIGTAAVACGGEVSRGCGIETAIIFTACTPRYRSYFDATTASDDELARALVGKRPPSGNRWVVECGAADAMVRGQPPAWKGAAGPHPSLHLTQRSSFREG
jgi:hypothetical protein